MRSNIALVAIGVMIVAANVSISAYAADQPDPTSAGITRPMAEQTSRQP